MAISYLSALDIDSGITTASSSTLAGATFTSGLSMGDNDITITGSGKITTPEIENSAAMLLDCGGDITLDADGAQVRFKDAGTERFTFNLDATPELDVTGGTFTIHNTTSDADVVIIGNDGGSSVTALTIDMSAAGAATFNNDVTAFSDARLKENVETIDNALDKVCAMRGVTFNRIDNEDGGRQMGVIAQEVQDIVPEVVKTNDDEDNTLSVSYGNMVGVLIEAIKELKQEIKELKGE